MVTDQLTFEQVVRAVHRWRPEQKAALLTTLQNEQTAPELTREQLIAELDALRAAGAFDHVDSLRDQYPSPALNGVSDQQLRAAIREAATEYKTDILELTDHGSSTVQALSASVGCCVKWANIHNFRHRLCHLRFDWPAPRRNSHETRSDVSHPPS
jgi:bacterioferritin-associated ferredoxin